MEFSIGLQDLKTMIQNAILPTKPSSSVEEFSHFYIQADADGHLIIVGSGNDASLIANYKCQLVTAGRALVPIKNFDHIIMHAAGDTFHLKLIETVPADDATVTTKRLEISIRGDFYSIIVKDPAKYSPLGTWNKDNKIYSIHREHLLTALTRLAPSISQSAIETNIYKLYIKTDEMATSNSTRLGVYTIDTGIPELTIAADHIPTILACLESSDSKNILLQYDNDCIYIQYKMLGANNTENNVLVLRRPDNKFPKYERILESVKLYDKQFKLNDIPLLEKKVRIVSVNADSKYRGIRFSFIKDPKKPGECYLRLEARDEYGNSSRSYFHSIEWSGDPFEFTFQYDDILNALKTLQENSTVVRYETDPRKPILFEEGNFKLIVSPIIQKWDDNTETAGI